MGEEELWKIIADSGLSGGVLAALALLGVYFKLNGAANGTKNAIVDHTAMLRVEIKGLSSNIIQLSSEMHRLRDQLADHGERLAVAESEIVAGKKLLHYQLKNYE